MLKNLIEKLRSININLIYIDSCKSTNAFASLLMETRGIDNNTVIVAENQTQGKGQLNAAWQSQDGKNLTFSIIIYHKDIENKHLFYLNIATSLAIYKSLKNFDLNDVKIKWPNDIYVSNKKICGILIESQIQGKNITSSIIGIGLNVNQRYILPENATSIASLLNIEISKENLLIDILENFKSYYSYIEKEEFDHLHQLYLSNLYWYNELHTYKSGTETFEAKIINITKEGNLVLSLLDGSTEKYGIKQIEFIH